MLLFGSIESLLVRMKEVGLEENADKTMYMFKSHE
jgi:hypothetical protein